MRDFVAGVLCDGDPEMDTVPREVTLCDGDPEMDAEPHAETDAEYTAEKEKTLGDALLDDTSVNDAEPEVERELLVEMEALIALVPLERAVIDTEVVLLLLLTSDVERTAVLLMLIEAHTLIVGEMEGLLEPQGDAVPLPHTLEDTLREETNEFVCITVPLTLCVGDLLNLAEPDLAVVGDAELREERLPEPEVEGDATDDDEMLTLNETEGEVLLLGEAEADTDADTVLLTLAEMESEAQAVAVED